MVGPTRCLHGGAGSNDARRHARRPRRGLDFHFTMAKRGRLLHSIFLEL